MKLENTSKNLQDLGIAQAFIQIVNACRNENYSHAENILQGVEESAHRRTYGALLGELLGRGFFRMHLFPDGSRNPVPVNKPVPTESPPAADPSRLRAIRESGGQDVVRVRRARK